MACRFAEKTRFFRSLWAGRHCVAASRSTFFKVETLYCHFFGRFGYFPFPSAAEAPLWQGRQPVNSGCFAACALWQE